MPPSTSRLWVTIQSPKHKLHEPTPTQNYLWNAQKPPITPKKPCHWNGVLLRGQNGKAFPEQGLVSHSPSQPEQPQGRFPQITGLWGRVITKTTQGAQAGSGSTLYLGTASSAQTRPPPTRRVNQESRRQSLSFHSHKPSSLFPGQTSPTWPLAPASWAQARAVARHNTQ